MEKAISETMDVTSFSKEELEKKVNEFFMQGWQIEMDGIDESITTDEVTGLSIITYTRTLVKYATAE